MMRPGQPRRWSGGTITVLQQADFEHLDPAQNYVNVQQITALLFLRGLTVFREHPDGSFELVGDLATNTGVTNDGGRTWTYTLRDGLKYEDGRPSDLPPRAVPHPMLVPAPVESREGRASSGTRATA